MNNKPDLSVAPYLTLDGYIVSTINDPGALALWVKMKSHRVGEVRLPKLRDMAKAWGFGTARFNSSFKILKDRNLVEVYSGAVNRKWVRVA